MTSDTPTRLHPLDGIAREDIRITDLKVTLLSYLLKPEEQWADGDEHMVIWQTTTVLAQVYTDAGIVGFGGGSRYNGPEAMKRYAEAIVRPALLGKNPFDVEHLAACKCERGPRGIWAAVDTALWDIIGQAKGLPVYRLLATDGEPTTRIRVYASGGEYSWAPNSRFPGPDHLIEEALSYKAQGYTAFKFRLGAGFNRVGVTMKQYIPYLERLRAAVGPDMDLMQEANCRLSVDQVLELAPALEELGFLWFEEPTAKRGEHAIDNYLRIKEALPTVKISGAETTPNRQELAEWVDRGALDIVQHGSDDAGITEAWHMARMAAQRGILCCPHNWQCGAVTIANAHLMAGIPNAFLLESNMTPNPLKEGLFNEPFKVVDGYIQVPDRPGLGVTLREGLEEEYPYLPGHWNKMVWELG